MFRIFYTYFFEILIIDHYHFREPLQTIEKTMLFESESNQLWVMVLHYSEWLFVKLTGFNYTNK